MRRYGKRHAVVLIFGASLSIAAAIFAILDELGVALAGISLLMGLGLFVTLDNRQRLRDLAGGNQQSQRVAASMSNVTDRLAGLNRRVTDLAGRLDASDTRLLASLETARTDALDRHVQTMAHLDQPNDQQQTLSRTPPNN